MARLLIWLLATVAAVGLATTTDTETPAKPSLPTLPLEVQLGIISKLSPENRKITRATSKDLLQTVNSWDQQEYGKVFSGLRRHLGLLGMDGSPALVGLKTLIDGAQIEYRAMVEELFEVLASRDLLTNFQAIVDPRRPGPHSSEGGETTDQTPAAANPMQLWDFDVFMHRFWLKVIGGDNAKQLRYYLSNMLVFNVIPQIIGQVLESGERDKALEKALKLADEISQLGGITTFIQDHPGNVPNYFEFIMLYATMQQFDNLDSLLPVIQQKGDVKVYQLYNCFAGFEEEFSLHTWEDIFSLKLPSDFGQWLDENQRDCNPLLAKYMRNFYFTDTPVVNAYYLEGEDTTDWFE
ncbi:hypothetical protein H4R35_001286 [Dimargaris xerosporica]|nr:hypothetical protein H4R35_001286 [Dimargaris xerosporica]